jgi:hypothetical protein
VDRDSGLITRRVPALPEFVLYEYPSRSVAPARTSAASRRCSDEGLRGLEASRDEFTQGLGRAVASNEHELCVPKGGDPLASVRPFANACISRLTVVAPSVHSQPAVRGRAVAGIWNGDPLPLSTAHGSLRSGATGAWGEGTTLAVPGGAASIAAVVVGLDEVDVVRSELEPQDAVTRHAPARTVSARM